ncbi:MAG: type II CAAX endopeptidase family protein [Fulvivirga sp.]
MIGILVALAISWGLVYFIEKKNLLVLGFLPIGKKIIQFLIGFIITAVLCVIVQYWESILSSSILSINKDTSLRQITSMLWWDFRSVITEELIFRGAILYILIKKLNGIWAVIISAIAFGIYHWFSFGVFGDIVPMIFVFIGTGLSGYAWALAFYKTNSILMPIGLHLGWNFTHNTIFSQGPLGDGLIVSVGGTNITDWFSLVGLLLIPTLTLVVIKYAIPNENQRQLVKAN